MKQPLAYRLRPQTLDEVIGQQHLIGEGQVIRKCIENKTIFSMIFFGEPGTGKTTLATVIANELDLPYRIFNAVTGNKKDLTIIFEEARMSANLIVIIEEIHRLNKDKQDLLLPHIEDGTITMIGTTTSNPYFSINPAIRSRCHLFEIKPLTIENIELAIDRALANREAFAEEISIDEDAKRLIATHSNGDMRYALNVLEICALAQSDNHITLETVSEYSKLPNMNMDFDGDGHYDAVSAFQKSIRGGDVDAALYYLGRLIKANDMDSIERRLLVTAYEDIGLANPAAVGRTIQAIDAAKRVGFPEGMIPLSVAIIDLTLSPKSKSANNAIHAVMEELDHRNLAVPRYLRLTPVGLDEDEKYPYDRSDLWHRIQYLPDEIKDSIFYNANSNSTYEKALADNRQKLKQEKRSNNISKLKG